MTQSDFSVTVCPHQRNTNNYSSKWTFSFFVCGVWRRGDDIGSCCFGYILYQNVRRLTRNDTQYLENKNIISQLFLTTSSQESLREKKKDHNKYLITFDNINYG